MVARDQDPTPYSRGGLITVHPDADPDEFLAHLRSMPCGPFIPASIAKQFGASFLQQLNDNTYQRYSQTRDHVWEGD
ncbi:MULTISPECIES: hypothetical protein [unclassified Mycobacterium]|uniref:hypothetical protein n=1 Tax=unclassified Mycobacterium TaxID=2642494 RepID=UPI000B2B68CC|nr:MULTISPECIES: hypothetical protein [unclassified Mycobacterium]